MKGSHLLILLVMGVVLWRVAPQNPVTLRGLIVGLGYLLMGISLYGFASKLEALRKTPASKSKQEETRVYASVEHQTSQALTLLRDAQHLNQTKRARGRKS